MFSRMWLLLKEMNLKIIFWRESYLWGYTRKDLRDLLQFRKKVFRLLLLEVTFLRELRMGLERQLHSAFLPWKKLTRIRMLFKVSSPPFMFSQPFICFFLFNVVYDRRKIRTFFRHLLTIKLVRLFSRLRLFWILAHGSVFLKLCFLCHKLSVVPTFYPNYYLLLETMLGMDGFKIASILQKFKDIN